MRCLTLTQPWATAVFLGLKHYETRSWRTNYRGPLLIHAAKGWKAEDRAFLRARMVAGQLTPKQCAELPFGVIIGRVDLVDCVPTATNQFSMGDAPEGEWLWGNYSSGRYVWKLANPVRFAEPIPYRGALGLFEVPDDALTAATRDQEAS